MWVDILTAARQVVRLSGNWNGGLSLFPAIIVLLTLLPGYAAAFLYNNGVSVFRIASEGNEIGSPLFIVADIGVSNCDLAHQLRVVVKDMNLDSSLTDFGPVQRIEVEIIDEGPLPRVFCDTISDVRFTLPIGKLLAPRVEVTALITDRILVDGQEQMQTSLLFEGVLELDRPLVPIVHPANPTVLDEVIVTINTNTDCFSSYEDALVLIVTPSVGSSPCSTPWHLLDAELGRLVAGTQIQVNSYYWRDSPFALLKDHVRADPRQFQDVLDVVVSHSIPPEASGSWYNTDNPGRGLTIQVLDDERLIAYWYTFDPEGQQVWIFGDGRVLPPAEGIEGVIVRFDGSLVSGGVFGPGFDPDAAIMVPWGEFDLQFDACDSALHSWRPSLSGWEAGNEVLKQLAGINGFDCDSR